MATVLTEAQAQEKAAQLRGWSLKGKTIQTVKTFDGFVEAVDFVNKLVEPAESAGHHPDLAISYNQVTITLTSHDAGGLTEADFKMAQIISKLS
ncbi:MAG: 4a-hydroxytetrahydrobiopterin dehydratase [Leptolyngbyaceae cyanobacterium SL_1_1]|nr:4a-hydroxytetrahydrobiopterin dehydratase [Leptolyngbyaceae cyanobacterium RM1_1_2]NJO10664.1 4a-hydroxytetrahydrobiopterin dehydratase [Leptolyngbyaceae cyanobacterium SL_1_1]